MEWTADNLRQVRKVRTGLIAQSPPLLLLHLDVLADVGKPTQRLIEGQQHALVQPVVVELIRQLQEKLLVLQAMSAPPNPESPTH